MFAGAHFRRIFDVIEHVVTIILTVRVILRLSTHLTYWWFKYQRCDNKILSFINLTARGFIT